jgi:hypothetical protein
MKGRLRQNIVKERRWGGGREGAVGHEGGVKGLCVYNSLVIVAYWKQQEELALSPQA